MFDDKGGNGSSFCHQCGGRTGFQLAQALRGWDGRTAVKEIREIIGSVQADPVRTGASDDDKRKWNRVLWDQSRPVQKGDPVDRYLTRRGVGLEAYPRCLRFAPECRWGPQKAFPAMIALIEGTTGPVLLHRTYLTEDGGKADVEDARRMMPGKVPDGGSVRLAPAAAVMGVAEGIETALAASRYFEMPVWAGVTAVGLSNFAPPPGCSRLYVFGDNDTSFTGQAVAYALARRLKTLRPPIEVEVRLPDVLGTDWADMLKEDA